jgi:hypothetical protein
VSKHALRLLNHPEPANGERCRRLLLPERGSLDAARRQTYARAHVGSEELGAGFVRKQQPRRLIYAPARLLLCGASSRVAGRRRTGACGRLRQSVRVCWAADSEQAPSGRAWARSPAERWRGSRLPAVASRGEAVISSPWAPTLPQLVHTNDEVSDRDGYCSARGDGRRISRGR